VVLAYFAGVVDSDGTISIRRDPGRLRRNGTLTQPTYSERVGVRQIEPQAVDLLGSGFGGYRAIVRPKRGQPLHKWEVHDRMASDFLVQILPYLRIKVRQAEVCLRLRELKNESRKLRWWPGHKGGGPRPIHLSTAMEEARQEVLLLNKVDGRFVRYSVARQIARKNETTGP
jgi:hypothetical protein